MNLMWMATSTVDERSQAVQNFTMHHVGDSSQWILLPGVQVPLPWGLTVHALMVVFSAVLLTFLLTVLYRKNDPVPRGFTNCVEAFVLFIRDDICVEYLGREDGRRMAPLFLSFFFFILTMNAVGLFPCFAAATGNISVTAALALVTLGFMIVGAMVKNGVGGFFKGFVPHGVPWPILVLLVPLEIVGLFIKAFALAVRLFVNMRAGHIVIFSLLGLVIMFGTSGVPATLIGIPSVLMALAIFVLEILIAVLQAYIFTLLSAIFIGQRYHPSH